ncbi:hypothetical protein E2562_027032 [Oryza meyeriana var. granulata]|uniref:DUF834 domain-containing protein n=1 Tax=Oryza meyeriana var. granulata TaxID=110450 RepID=A0A6G1C9J4_9ORYZ|nr:hypothetical protein E2562_027032 [Oryza meyeriana var. granulata]
MAKLTPTFTTNKEGDKGNGTLELGLTTGRVGARLDKNRAPAVAGEERVVGCWRERKMAKGTGGWWERGDGARPAGERQVARALYRHWRLGGWPGGV